MWVCSDLCWWTRLFCCSADCWQLSWRTLAVKTSSLVPPDNREQHGHLYRFLMQPAGWNNKWWSTVHIWKQGKKKPTAVPNIWVHFHVKHVILECWKAKSKQWCFSLACHHDSYVNLFSALAWNWLTGRVGKYIIVKWHNCFSVYWTLYPCYHSNMWFFCYEKMWHCYYKNATTILYFVPPLIGTRHLFFDFRVTSQA